MGVTLTSQRLLETIKKEVVYSTKLIQAVFWLSNFLIARKRKGRLNVSNKMR